MSEDMPKIDIQSLGFHWVLPKDLEEDQDVWIHVIGLSIAPILDFPSEQPAGELYPGKAHRVYEKDELIGITIGDFYLIEEQFLDNPRIVAIGGDA